MRAGTGREAPRALAFDVYGTLVDTSAMGAGLPDGLGAAWRRHQLEITWLVSLMGRYESFEQVSRDALDVALGEAGLDLTREERAALVAGLATLPAQADADEALALLARAGIELAVLSNGSPSMLSALLEEAGLAGHFTEVISADEVRTYKPDPAVYLHGVRRLGRGANEVWLVSGNPFDCAGAKAAGLGAARIERRAAPAYPFADPPDLVVPSLAALARKLTEAP